MPSWRSYKLCMGMWIILQTSLAMWPHLHHHLPNPLLEKLLQGTRELNFLLPPSLVDTCGLLPFSEAQSGTCPQQLLLRHQNTKIVGQSDSLGTFAALSCSALGGVCVATPHGSCRQLATHFGATQPPPFTPCKLSGLYVTLCFLHMPVLHIFRFQQSLSGAV